MEENDDGKDIGFIYAVFRLLGGGYGETVAAQRRNQWEERRQPRDHQEAFSHLLGGNQAHSRHLRVGGQDGKGQRGWRN